MKKITVLLASVALISMASCKKERTCNCITTDSDENFPPNTAVTTSTLSKKDAESWCAGSSAVSLPFTTVCTLVP